MLTEVLTKLGKQNCNRYLNSSLYPLNKKEVLF